MTACCSGRHRWNDIAVIDTMKRKHVRCCNGQSYAGRAMSATCAKSVGSTDPVADGIDVCFLEL